MSQQAISFTRAYLPEATLKVGPKICGPTSLIQAGVESPLSISVVVFCGFRHVSHRTRAAD
jgi:hypothetical protein